MEDKMARMNAQISRGFTLIEVVIAMALFSLFLIATVGSLGALSKIYQKGIAIRRATDNSRSLIEDVSRVARYASSATAASDPNPPDNNGDTVVTTNFPVVSPSANVTCGPDLILDTPTSQGEFKFQLTSRIAGATVSKNSYVMNFVNNALPSNISGFATQADGTRIDVNQPNAFGIGGSYPGAYVFCVYNNPPYSYVKISFTINSASTIKGTFLFLNVSNSGSARGDEFTTTIPIGGAG
jgi:prepilin-type N-terminal cleavage/methylation domain-containing protein